VGRDEVRDALRWPAGLRRASRDIHALQGSRRHLGGLPDRGSLGRQARDAERIEREFELACGTVINDGLEEQVQDAEPLGDEELVPDRSNSATARWIAAADTVWRWTAASSSRSSAYTELELVAHTSSHETLSDSHGLGMRATCQNDDVFTGSSRGERVVELRCNA
jgi:hypothetical protein